MYLSSRKAFTMVELVFVIVVIGILAAVAVPKLVATTSDAEVLRARTTVAALRTAISTARQQRVLSGNFTQLTGTEAVALLEYGLTPDWVLSASINRLTFTGPSNNTCSFDVNNSKLLKVSGCGVAGFSDL